VTDHGSGFMLKPSYPQSTHFDASHKRLGRRYQQPAMTCRKMHAVVPHQAGKRQQSGLRGIDDGEREP
jgi:hypothetical protein